MQTAKDVRVKMMKGMLDILILRLLAEQAMHGYGMITVIRRRYGVYFGPSTIYPLVSALERKGYVKSDWNMGNVRPRKVYKLTEKGLALLQTSQTELKALVQPLIMSVEA